MDATRSLAELDGTAWRAVRFGPGLADVVPEDAEVSLQIDGDRVFGKSGCNRYFGGWAVDSVHLRIGPLASTMMYCDGLMELERAFLDTLGGAIGTRMEGDRLQFTASDGTPQLELVAADPESSP